MIFLLLLFHVAVAQKEVVFSILEEPQLGSVIGNVATEAGLAQKYGAAEFNKLSLQFLTKQPNLAIESNGINKGALSAIGRIDRELICPNSNDPCVINFDVAVGLDLKEIIKVKILVKDVNDNGPTFPNPNVTIFVRESAPVGSRHSIPAARDDDTSLLSVKSYSVESKDGFFQMVPIDDPSGISEIFLELKKKLDREKQPNHDVTIKASDGGDPSRVGKMNVRVIVTDFNDHSPIFKRSRYAASIPENTLPQTVIKKVTADDKDEGENARLTYRLSRSEPPRGMELFGVRDNTGDVYVKRRLNFKQGSEYRLTITAQDNGAEHKLSGSTVVVVKLTDFNDHAPKITLNTLSNAVYPQVKENGHEGDFVVYASIEDMDSGDGGKFRCSVKETGLFTLTKITDSAFKVLTNTIFDYEKVKMLNLTIICTDFGTPPLSSNRVVPVYIVDENDHYPVFNKSEYFVRIDEGQPAGTFVYRVTATDKDGGKNAEIRYSLGEDANGEFQINQRLGIISTSRVLDADPDDPKSRDPREPKVFTVFAHDLGNDSKSANATVTVVLNDISDNPPRFKLPKYELNVREGEMKKKELGKIEAFDPDLTKSRITYYLGVNSEGLGKFTIGAHNGILRSLGPLDREAKAQYILWAVAREARAPFHNSSVKVIVKVDDINDNSPVVTFPTTYNNTIHISYLTPKGRMIGKIEARDADSGENGALVYEIFQGNRRDLFELDRYTGRLRVIKALQPSDKLEYKLTIIIRDQGHQKPESVFRTLIVKVSDPEGLADRFGGQLGDKTSLMIIIILAAVSATVSIFIIVIIILIRRRYNSDIYYDAPSKPTEGNEYITFSPKGDLEMQKQSRPPVIIRTDCDSMGSSETNKSNGSGNASLPLIRRPMDTSNRPNESPYSTTRVGMRLQRFQPPPPNGQSPPYYTTSEHQRAFGFRLNDLDVGNNETASNCDSGKGTSEEDLRRIREENAMSQANDCGYSNRTLQTFQRKPVRPLPNLKTSSLQALDHNGIENDNFKTNSDSPGTPPNDLNAGEGNGLQIMPNVVDIRGGNVTNNAAEREKSRFEQYTVV